ncbi:hypothetical protein [Vibrio zhanjiangensis]|nr:hypothetical protein [Vibrio zhanjiangensis]
MNKSKIIFPENSMAYEAEIKAQPVINTETDESTFFPKTSIALENEIRATRVTPGANKGFLSPEEKG